MKKRQFSRDEIERICSLYLKNFWGTPKIGKEFDATSSVIRRVLIEEGVGLRGIRRARFHGRAVTPEQEKEAARLYLVEEQSSPDIAQTLGVSSSAVRAALNRQGVELRDTKEAASLTTNKKEESEAERREDLTGQKFGKLTVIGLGGKKIVEKESGQIKKRQLWILKCSCGNPALLEGLSAALKGGKLKSCGCIKRDNGEKMHKELTGQTFGKLKVLEKLEDRMGNWEVMYRCKCECGNETTTTGRYLRTGHTKSCGKCYQRNWQDLEVVRQAIKEFSAERGLPPGVMPLGVRFNASPKGRALITGIRKHGYLQEVADLLGLEYFGRRYATKTKSLKRRIQRKAGYCLADMPVEVQRMALGLATSLKIEPAEAYAQMLEKMPLGETPTTDSKERERDEELVDLVIKRRFKQTGQQLLDLDRCRTYYSS